MQHTIVFHLIAVSRGLQKAIGLNSREIPLSYSQTSALSVISSQSQISQTELAATLNLTPASVVTLVDELERLSLAKRHIVVNNRRKYQIQLTKKGKILAQKVKKETDNLENFIKKTLNPKKAKAFFLNIEKINSALGTWHPNNVQRKEVNNEFSSPKRNLAA
ncbi:MAG: MarR family winged helix-turn-helix transcriptional regulator [Patescibacteria group bacterium]